MDEQCKLMLLELLEDRYGHASTIITSQLSVSHWHDLIASSTIADAICDRLIHNSQKIEIEGDSMRKRSNNHSG
jgi:DNA replication protein DnaC